MLDVAVSPALKIISDTYLVITDEFSVLARQQVDEAFKVIFENRQFAALCLHPP